MGLDAEDLSSGRRHLNEAIPGDVHREEDLVQVLEEGAQLAGPGVQLGLGRLPLRLRLDLALRHGQADVEQGDVHGLGHVVVGTGLQYRLEDVGLILSRHHEDDRLVSSRAVAYAPGELQPVDAGEDEVQQQQMSELYLERIPRRLPVLACRDDVPAGAEDLREQPPLTGIVLDQQDVKEVSVRHRLQRLR